ncbi:MAG: hypothetical protein HY361_00530 [Candidatus Aenigmarchaeota archaeon]|nr:hypothetical protein [Candidatus Aenigmarchaeota archaeon]
MSLFGLGRKKQELLNPLTEEMRRVMGTYLKEEGLPYTPYDLGFRKSRTPCMSASNSYDIYVATVPPKPIIILDEDRAGKLTVHGSSYP